MQETTLKIGGMTCDGCVANVEKILRGIDGVERADVSLDEGLARVRFDAQRTSVAELVDAVEDAGFDAEAA